MSRFLLFAVLSAGLLNALQGAPPPELTQLQAQYAGLLAERVDGPYHTGMAALDGKFLSALDSATTEAKKAGRLADVIAIEEDRKLVANHRPLPAADDAETPEALKNLRRIYRDATAKLSAERAAHLQAILPAYVTKLQDLETTLTKADRVAEAESVLAYREELAEEIAAPPTPGIAPGAPPDLKANPLIRGDMSLLPAPLQQARPKGGRLRLWGTIDGKPLPVDDGQFKQKDFVAVTIQPDAAACVQAVRKNGDGVSIMLHDGSIDEMKDVYRLNRGFGTQWLDSKGRVWNRTKLELDSGHSKAAHFSGMYRGILVASATGEWKSTAPGAVIPNVFGGLPSTWFDGLQQLATSANHMNFLYKDGSVRTWSLLTGEAIPVAGSITSVVEMEGGVNHAIVRNRDGTVTFLSDGRPSAPAQPAERPPAVTVRAGFDGYAYQKTDGTWLVLNDSSELAAKAREIGPALDLGIFKKADGPYGIVQILAWIEPPEETLEALKRAAVK